MHQIRYNIEDDVKLLVDRSSVVFEQFRGANILVTGGTGFFGIWILLALIEIRNRLGGNLNLFVVSRQPNQFLHRYGYLPFENQIKFLEADITTVKFSELRISHLVHMATTSAAETFAGENQINKLDMLYRGTKNILEQCGPTLKNVLFTSSGVVYGNSKSEYISETEHPAIELSNIGSALALGKLNAEYLINYYSEKFGYSYSIARCFSFAGPYLPLDIHYAFGNFIKNVLCGEDIVIRSDGLDIRSYLYIGDAIAWILRLFAEPKNLTLNIGSEQKVSIRDLAIEICQSHPSGSQIQILGTNFVDGNFQRKNYVPSLEKIMQNYQDLKEWTLREEIIKKMLKVLA